MTAIKKLMAAWSLQNDTSELMGAFQAWGRRYDLYMNGYLPATMQRNFSVMVKPGGKNVAKVKRGLKLLAEVCKPHPNKQDLADHFYVGIFEHTLSEDGSYHMLIARDLTSAVVIKCYYRMESVEFTGSLDEALAHVAAHHWYG